MTPHFLLTLETAPNSAPRQVWADKRKDGWLLETGAKLWGVHNPWIRKVQHRNTVSQSLKPNERRLLEVLRDNRPGLSKLSRDALAHLAGYSEAGAIKRLLDRLQAKGHIYTITGEPFNIRLTDKGRKGA